MSNVVFLYLPGNGQFFGELIFGYNGCQSGMQRGSVSGTVSENSIIGEWNGSVDGFGVCGRYNGVLSEGGKIYSGTYVNSNGKTRIDCNEYMRYFIAGKGTRQVYGSKSSLNMKVTVDFEEDMPNFEWTDFDDLEYYHFLVVDKECLEQKQDIEQYMMGNGEYVFSAISYGEKYDDFSNAHDLVKGKTYLIHI